MLSAVNSKDFPNQNVYGILKAYSKLLGEYLMTSVKLQWIIFYSLEMYNLTTFHFVLLILESN